MRRLDIVILEPNPRPIDCVVNQGTAIICVCDLCQKEWEELFKKLGK